MKKLITLFASTLLCIATAMAQSPQKMSYQAVIRNASNNLVANHSIGMQVSILQGSESGLLVYSEVQTPSTNSNGLVSIEIGAISAGFDTINWANGPYFIKTETDPSGGTNYTIIGTSQLLSVPYAQYATNCSSIFHKSGKYGIGTTSPAATFDIAGGNNWNVVDGEGDFRLGNNSFKLKIGVALDGGGAGDVTLMQQGQKDGYNVLSLGAQGTKILYINGASKSIGIGTDAPTGKLDIVGGNNWDLTNGEGDFRLGNSSYRLKIGVALAGGGAGDAGIMQQGKVGGYNVLSLGAQGTKLLYINGNSKAVGIGTDDPKAALDITSTTKGFLPPRMTQVQRDLLTAVEGLIIYNTTTHKPNYYDGSGWKNYDGTAAK